MEAETQARFNRIEIALETMAKGLSSLTTDSHYAFVSLNATQHNLIEESQRMLARMSKTDNDVAALFKSNFDIGAAVKDLIASQILMVKAQEKSELAQAETQGKLDALIHMWDDWIRGRNGKTKGDSTKQ